MFVFSFLVISRGEGSKIRLPHPASQGGVVSARCIGTCGGYLGDAGFDLADELWPAMDDDVAHGAKLSVWMY